MGRKGEGMIDSNYCLLVAYGILVETQFTKALKKNGHIMNKKTNMIPLDNDANKIVGFVDALPGKPAAIEKEAWERSRYAFCFVYFFPP